MVEETNTTGAVVARYSDGLNIDEPLAMLRSAATSYCSLTNQFQYTARESDTETGLYYYRARYYDSVAGRFSNEDPARFEGGSNFYTYVGNSSTMANDPSGLCRVVVLYYPVMGGKYHANLLVSNNTGGSPNPWTYRAGPGNGGTYWTPDLEAIAIPALDPANPDPLSEARRAQIILNDQSDCKCIRFSLDTYTRRVNNSNIPYHSTSTNSNAFASGAISAAGLPLPTPPVPVPGWGTPLPVKGP